MLTVTYHAGHPRVATVDAEIGTDHDTLAGIIAVFLTGDRETRHVLTIDNVEPVIEPTEVSAYAAELRLRHERIAAGLIAFRSVSPIPGVDVSTRLDAEVVFMAARDQVWAMYLAEIEKVSA